MTIVFVKNNIIFYEKHIYSKGNIFSVNRKIESNIIFYNDDIIYNNRFSVKGNIYEFLGKRLFSHNGEIYTVENNVLRKDSKYVLYDVDIIESADGIVYVYRNGKSYFYDSFFKPILTIEEKFDLISFNRNFYLTYSGGLLQLRKYDETVHWEKRVENIFKIGLFKNYVIYKTKLVHIFNFKTGQYEDFNRSYRLNSGNNEFIEKFLQENSIPYEQTENITYCPTDFFVTDSLYLVYYNNIYNETDPLYESVYKNINVNNILLSIYKDIHIVQFQNKVYFNDYLIKNTGIKYNQIFLGNFLFENFTLTTSNRTYKVDTHRLYIYNKKELEGFFDFDIHYIYIYKNRIYIYTFKNELVEINTSLSVLYEDIYLTNIVNDEEEIVFLSFNKKIGDSIFKDVQKLAFEREKKLEVTVEETSKLKRRAGEFLKKTENIKKKF